MSVDRETVRRIARLARLRVGEEALEPMARELNAILAFVADLDAVDTEGVPPLTSVVETVLKRRQDVVTDGGDAAAVVRNAPDRVDGFFAVPKVVE